MSWSMSSGLGNASFADLAHAVIQKLPLTKADELAGLQELERAVCARRRALEVEASGQPESRPAEETAARLALGGQFAQLPAGQFAQSQERSRSRNEQASESREAGPYIFIDQKMQARIRWS